MLTALYVPATRPDRWGKAAASGADVVIIDLEDAVPIDQKVSARNNLAEHIGQVEGVGVQVRVNAVGTPWHEDDLNAVAGLPCDVEVRMPKCEDPAQVGRMRERVAGRGLHLLLESALGVERAFELARLEDVASIGLGEADLRGQVGVGADAVVRWMRARVVCASLAAGLGAPLGPMYPHVGDLEGLVTSTRELVSQGFLGRTLIHPSQVAKVLQCLRPSEPAVARARQVIDSAVEITGVITLPDGSFVDRAMLGQHQRVLELARRLGVALAQ